MKSTIRNFICVDQLQQLHRPPRQATPEHWKVQCHAARWTCTRTLIDNGYALPPEHIKFNLQTRWVKSNFLFDGH